MDEDYREIVHRYFEELKPLFLNYLHSNFHLDYDEIMYLYTEVWIDVRSNIQLGRVAPDTKWKSYILKIGRNKAANRVSRRRKMVSIDDAELGAEKFDVEQFKQNIDSDPLTDNPGLQTVLESELSYIPDPCNKILKLFYYEELTMAEIAQSMNYSSSRTAITTKNRCLDKLRKRVVDTARYLGIIE